MSYIAMEINLPFFIGIFLFVVTIILLYILLRVSEKQDIRNLNFKKKLPKSKFGILIGLDSDVEGEIFVVREQGLTLGRDASVSNVVSENLGVSREHARIIPENGQTLILDIRSKNGTYVNGKRIVETILQDGDRITLGKRRPTSFLFRINP